ncbi:hypothetical protein, partial [Acinetobacter baumannii]|uniref:hypothetical protein n=1 Tax=Acinetobacter baumannii TaxID=470 RepID=UPI0033952B27
WKRLGGFRPYGTWYSDSVVEVSVACLFSRGGVGLASHPTLLLSHPGLGPAMAEFGRLGT